MLLLAGWSVEARAQSPCGGHIQIVSENNFPPIAVIQTLNNNGLIFHECSVAGQGSSVDIEDAPCFLPEFSGFKCKLNVSYSSSGSRFEYEPTAELFIPEENLPGISRRAFVQHGVKVRIKAVGGDVRLGGIVLHDGEETDLGFGTGSNFVLDGPGSLSGSFRNVVTVEPVRTNSLTFSWKGPSGGSYSDPNNWNPDCDFPRHAEFDDTAEFTDEGAGNSVSATNATAGRWVISTPIDLNGSARVFSTSTTEPSLTVFSSAFSAGSLLLDGGATFESVHASLGTGVSPSSSNVTVSGDGSLWMSTGAAIIGDPSEARLIIENGGRVEAVDPNGLAAVLLGKVDGTSGRVEVRGIQNSGTAPSTLRVQLLNVGNRNGNGVGNVLIENGGLVDVVDVGAAFFRGSITVAGQNGSTNGRSTLKAKPTFAIAAEPGSQLEVKDGALLNTDDVVVGTDGLTGRILVNNSGNSSLPPFDANVPISGAAWVADGSIQLDGQNGPAELIVEDNGVVTCTGNLLLGQSAGSAGKVSVADGGSIGVVGDLTVGGSGRGELNINADGRLTSGPATVGSGPDPNSRGRVVISAGQVSDAEWEVTGDLTVGGGTRATGLGAFEPFKGEVFLQDSTLFGEPTLSVTGHLFVFAQGAILGNGTLAVPRQRRVVNGGIISPGLSPGRITIEGDYEQPEGGTLVIEVAGVQPGQFDVLHVTGNATLAGKVDLRFIDGFVPRPGDNIDFVKVDGTITGKLTGSAFIDAPGDPAAGRPAAQAEVRWEVTPEGTCRMTVTNVRTVDDLGHPLPTECGAGLCGAGAVPLMPLTLIGLAALKASRRLRVR